MFDIVIRSGKIVDGTGNPWFPGDIGIVDDRIVAVGSLSGAEGRIDIDFKLIPVEEKWLLRDVYLDGVSLVRNLRTQCLKIIRENSYEELLNRMKKKIREADTATVSEVTGR